MNDTQVAMIKNMISTKEASHQCDMDVLYFLKFTPGLILTGSRHFGNYHEDSDYDFFIDSSLCTEQFYCTLNDLGFEQHWDSSYNSDPSVENVYQYYNDKLKVHIQIIRSGWFERKVYAQNRITELFRILPGQMFELSKDRIKSLWKYFYLKVR